MQNTEQNNKRIAKNTLILYCRMLFTMLLSLYTSRVVLDSLGVEDFGIYNVVGGVIAMSTVVTGAFTASIVRFITVEFGRNDLNRLKKVFATSVNIQITMSVVTVAFMEIAGLWFLNYKMNISDERLTAANWVLQCSLITYVIGLISIPYNSAIIAHEKMSVFAYIGIFEAVSKLLVAFLIYISPYDKLIFYAIMLCILSLLIRYFYSFYCIRHFEECRYSFVYDKKMFKEMLQFAGWSVIGASANVSRDQGVNIIINIFCGSSVNAARAVSFQVNNAVHNFVNNFMTAVKPQIMKNYAVGNIAYLHQLILQSSRLSYYLLLFLSVPIILEADNILCLWLKTVPKHTVMFVQLALIWGMTDALLCPLDTAIMSTGKIKKYQIIDGLLQLANLPISYLLLKKGVFPEITIVISIIISQFCLLVRLFLLKSMIRLSVRLFFFKVYANIILVSLFALIVPCVFHFSMSNSYIRFLIVIVSSLFCTTVSIWYIGCSSEERNFAKHKIRSLINKTHLSARF